MYAVCRFSKKKKYNLFCSLLLFCKYVNIYINVRQKSYIVSKFVIGREVAMAQVCNSCFLFFVLFCKWCMTDISADVNIFMMAVANMLWFDHWDGSFSSFYF